MSDRIGPAPLGFLDSWRAKLERTPMPDRDPRSGKKCRPKKTVYGLSTKAPVQRLAEGDWLSHGELRRMQRQSAKAAKARGL